MDKTNILEIEFHEPYWYNNELVKNISYFLAQNIDHIHENQIWVSWMHSDELYFYQMGITAVLVSFKIHNSYLVNTMEYILRKREIK